MNDSSQSANNPASRECAPIALGELSPGDSLETVRRRGTMIATRSARRATGLSWRAVLHKLHLWLGLSILIPLVALGISGSILVYQPEIEALLAGAPPVRTPGSPHPIAEIVAAARSAAPEGVDPVLYLPPRDDRGAAVVRLLQPTRGPRLFDVHVDPVSLEVLQIRSGTRPLRPVFQLHAGLLAGRAGREAVGWLGVMTLGMAASGLVLWWPPPRGWRLALSVSRGARGRRLWRELHGALGFWSLGLFVLVTFTGVHFVFAQPIRAAVARVLPVGDGWRAAHLPASPGAEARAIDADGAVAAALVAAPGARLWALALPVRPDQGYSANVLLAGASPGAPTVTVTVDPRDGSVVEVRDPARLPAGERVLAWQAPLHRGVGLGPVYRFVIFLSGLLPLVFAATGLSMWSMRRSPRRALMNAAAPPGRTRRKPS
jgi:uncharacterized iron-regulated membrane protein